jgi:membrane carboxypeptidase/penicillin-binding protein
MEVASAYTIFASGGEMRPLRAIEGLERAGDELPLHTTAPTRIARADTTFLVTSMLRSVVNEGTGAATRGMGFSHDAAGKTGTTNDLRDAWFVGFTPELLTVVWVGFDDNQPVGLSGSQAALPIWADFMMAALAGHPNVSFQPPAGVSFVTIDRDTGRLAQPGCPRIISEAFVSGTEPTEACELHRF